MAMREMTFAEYMTQLADEAKARDENPGWFHARIRDWERMEAELALAKRAIHPSESHAQTVMRLQAEVERLRSATGPNVVFKGSELKRQEGGS